MIVQIMISMLGLGLNNLNLKKKSLCCQNFVLSKTSGPDRKKNLILNHPNSCALKFYFVQYIFLFCIYSLIRTNLIPRVRNLVFPI